MLNLYRGANMKKKNLLLIGLISSVTAGIYYMGKVGVINRLKSAGYVTDSINDKGKIVNVLTDKGTSTATQKAEIVEEPKMFDYNNPATHSSSGYWLQNTVGIFYLPNLKDGKETGEYTEIKLGLDGTVEPTIIESVKEGIKQIIPFWK